MTEDEAVSAFDALNTDDPEQAHIDADGILLAAASPAVREAWERARDRARGFWYA